MRERLLSSYHYASLHQLTGCRSSRGFIHRRGKIVSHTPECDVLTTSSFSEGWRPGQPTTAVSSANAAQKTPFKLPQNINIPKVKAPKQRPEPPRSLTDTLLLKFASLTGMKIPSLTGETSLDRYTWADDVEQGIERITDDNWEEEIVYERLAFEEEKDRVWVIML